MAATPRRASKLKSKVFTDGGEMDTGPGIKRALAEKAPKVLLRLRTASSPKALRGCIVVLAEDKANIKAPNPFWRNTRLLTV
jgi:hypothetical protein